MLSLTESLKKEEEVNAEKYKLKRLVKFLEEAKG